MSPAGSLMWRIESDPILRSSILVVGLLDRPPATDGLANMIDRAALLLPQLRQGMKATSRAQ